MKVTTKCKILKEFRRLRNPFSRVSHMTERSLVRPKECPMLAIGTRDFPIQLLTVVHNIQLSISERTPYNPHGNLRWMPCQHEPLEDRNSRRGQSKAGAPQKVGRLLLPANEFPTTCCIWPLHCAKHAISGVDVSTRKLAIARGGSKSGSTRAARTNLSIQAHTRGPALFFAAVQRRSE